MNDTTDTSASLDDLLDDIGGSAAIDPKLAVMTPEQRLYYDMTAGKYHKMYNCRHWLGHELSICRHLIEDNSWIIGKSNKIGRVPVSAVELTRSLIKYWLLMTYLPRFDKTLDRRGCDIEIVLDMMMAHPEISRTIHQYIA